MEHPGLDPLGPYVKLQKRFLSSDDNPVYVFPSSEEAQLKSFAEKYKTAFLFSNLYCRSKQENTREAGISLVPPGRSVTPLRREM